MPEEEKELEGQTTLEEQIETAEEKKDEGKPVGPATIVSDESPLDAFPQHNPDA